MSLAHSHFVYRVYDAAGQPLYVGCTYDLTRRLKAHRTHAPWWDERARIEVDGPMPARVALQAEQDAIWSLGPIYNRPTAAEFYDFGLDGDGVTEVERPVKWRRVAGARNPLTCDNRPNFV